MQFSLNLHQCWLLWSRASCLFCTGGGYGGGGGGYGGSYGGGGDYGRGGYGVDPDLRCESDPACLVLVQCAVV